MKKSFLTGLTALAAAAVVFVGCSKNELTPYPVMDSVLSASEVPGEGSSGPLSWTGACAGEDLVLTLVGSGNKQIQQLIDGEWVQVAQVASGSAPLVGTVTNVQSGDYYFRYKVGSGGFSAAVAVTVVNCNCSESFSYSVDGDAVTFTYVPDEDYTDANLVFTFAQGVAVGGDLAGWSSNGVTKQKTMSLTACTTYTWTVTLDCAAMPGATNKWTDFKVNDDSKKNAATPNILCD